MNIIVLIKQVPESSNVRMDPETGTMIRKGAESVLNPLDLYAVETALRLRQEWGGSITAISMGPRSAQTVLKEAIAMGCDEGILVSDRKFGGSDTWATSYTLAKAIEQISSYDLIITGERATDGDTGQVGPGTAAWLALPVATFVGSVQVERRPTGLFLSADRMIEEGYQRVRFPLPGLITVVKEIAVPRLPNLEGKKRANAAQIQILDSETIPLEAANLGLQGSPTRVVKIRTPKVTREGHRHTVTNEDSLSESITALIDYLDSHEILSRKQP